MTWLSPIPTSRRCMDPYSAAAAHHRFRAPLSHWPFFQYSVGRPNLAAPKAHLSANRGTAARERLGSRLRSRCISTCQSRIQQQPQQQQPPLTSQSGLQPEVVRGRQSFRRDRCCWPDSHPRRRKSSNYHHSTQSDHFRYSVRRLGHNL